MMTERSPLLIHHDSIPTDIAEAILAVQTGLDILGKDEKNPFANFNYVSIDKYYATVAAAATAVGLSWFCAEVGSEVVAVPSAQDHDRSAIKFDYIFTMYHKNGHSVPCFDRISIYHPLQGAQTSGSAASYAEKLFMRKAFKVVTGEKDADASPGFDVDSFLNDAPAPTQKAPAPIPAPTPAPAPTPTQTPSADKKVQTETKPKPTNSNEPLEPGSDEPEDSVWHTANNHSDSIPSDYADEVDGVQVLRPIDNPANTAWEIVGKAFETFLPACQNIDSLKRFWTSNSKTIGLLKESAPTIHEGLVKMFTDRQNELS